MTGHPLPHCGDPPAAGSPEGNGRTPAAGAEAPPAHARPAGWNIPKSLLIRFRQEVFLWPQPGTIIRITDKNIHFYRPRRSAVGAVSKYTGCSIPSQSAAVPLPSPPEGEPGFRAFLCEMHDVLPLPMGEVAPPQAVTERALQYLPVLRQPRSGMARLLQRHRLNVLIGESYHTNPPKKAENCKPALRHAAWRKAGRKDGLVFMEGQYQACSEANRRIPSMAASYSVFNACRRASTSA